MEEASNTSEKFQTDAPVISRDHLLRLRSEFASLQSSMDSIQENLKRGLFYLEDRLQQEHEQRELAELTSALLEDRARFIDDNARAIIRSLQRRVGELESNKLSEAPSPSTPSSDGSPPVTEQFTEILGVRELQLERISAQLNSVNHDYIRQQADLVTTTEAFEKCRVRCIELQVELSRARRIQKDLETKLWQADRCTAFKQTLSASAVPVVVPFPDRLLQTDPGMKTKFLIPSYEFLAEFRAEMQAMAKSLSQMSCNTISSTIGTIDSAVSVKQVEILQAPATQAPDAPATPTIDS